MDIIRACVSMPILAAGAVGFAIFAYIKFVKTGPVYEGDADLTGKTVLITGGNVGIGKETAIELAKRNARVIIACRNVEKASRAVRDIRHASGSNTVHYMKLDLSDMHSVRVFVKEFVATEPNLHILVNNAGTITSGRTQHGLDTTFATNHLGPFLLTNLLLPLLKKTSGNFPVRIINRASAGYKAGKIDLENLNPNSDGKASRMQPLIQYVNTKLMNVYFTTELDKKLKVSDPEGQRITTFSVHPGVINSRLAGDHVESQGWLQTMLRNAIYLFVGRSCFYGCQTTLYCCLEKGIESESGKYFANLKSEKLLPVATDEKLGAKLWLKCEELCGLNQ